MSQVVDRFVMKPAAFLSLVAVSLAASAACGAEPGELPTRFAVPGTKLSVRLPEAGDGPVVLRALGRNWTEPVTPKDGAVQIELPAIRVPIAFSVVSAAKAGPVLARVVVYPADYRLKWDEKITLSIESEAPAWLKEWLAATNLPAKTVKPGDEPAAADRGSGGAGLFIVGRTAAGKSPQEFIERHALWQTNVLVLDAEWFGAPANEESRLPIREGDCFHHALAGLNRYAWPQAVSFQSVTGPWPGIANRWVWIDGPTSPLVEEVRASGNSRRIVFSYLPWHQQLGIETADAIFLSVLQAAARHSAGDTELNRQFLLVWPPAETVTPATRPVLATCLRERQSPRDLSTLEPKSSLPDSLVTRPPLSILDLRGPALSTNDAAVLPAVSLKQDWVVLGADPGVELPRPDPAKDSDEPEGAKKTRVIHLKDDALPSSLKGQVRLMQVLTDQGVFIGKFRDTKTIRRDP
jgi:hypothetical protein